MANEFLDLLTCYVAEHGLEKFEFRNFKIISIDDRSQDKLNAHFDEEVLTRLANMCPRISTIIINDMYELSQKGRV